MGYRRKILEARKRGRDRKKHLAKDADYVAANRQCFKKVAYSTEKRVIKRINEIAEEGRRGLRYYTCPFCELWHISSHKIRDQEFIS